MWGDEVASIGLFRIATAPNTMSRTPQTIAAGDPECLHFKVVLRGHIQAAQAHRADVLGPGDMTIYDTSQPAIFRAEEAFEGIVVRLPKTTLGGHATKMASLTALRIPGDGGLPRLAAQFFCGVAAGLADGSIARDDANVAERILDMVRGVYADRLRVGAARAAALADRACCCARRPSSTRTSAMRRLDPERIAARVRDLDALPAPAVRVRGADGLRVDPRRAPRPLPPRPARPGVRRPDDRRDRDALGAAEPAPLLAPVPQRLRALAARVSGQRSERCADRQVRSPPFKSGCTPDMRSFAGIFL